MSTIKNHAFCVILCNKRGRKPSSVVERSSILPRRCRRVPAISSEARRAAVSLPFGSCIGWGLHRAFVAETRVSSYLAFPSLLRALAGTGRFLSVALSLKSPSPAVNRHPALRCSDFPHGFRHATAWPPYRFHRITRRSAPVNGSQNSRRQAFSGLRRGKMVCIPLCDVV